MTFTGTPPQPADTTPGPQGFTGTDALLALMIVFWGLNFIVIKAALTVLSPLAFNAVRFTMAALSIALIAWSRGSRMPPRALIPRLAAMGVLANTIYQLAFIEGVARTRAGNAALIMAAVPVQTAVLSHLIGADRLRPRDGFGLLLSTAGIATIVLGSGRAVGFGSTVVGDLLVLSSTVCWTLFTLGSRPLVAQLGPITTTAWTMCLGAIPLLLICIPSALGQDWARVTPAAWAGTVFSGILSLSVAYVIWYRGVQKLGPARTAIYSNFTPVVAMLGAWALLGETPTAWQIGGAGGIFAGITLTRT